MPRRCAKRSAVAVLAAFACAVIAWNDVRAQTQFELSGNARFQIGSGFPYPIIGTPPPAGAVAAHGAALARQTSGPDPKQISIASGQLRAPGHTLNVGVFGGFGFNVFQVQTNLQIALPNAGAVLSAGGRTGAATTTFIAPPHVGGLLRYSATASQFGGPAPARQVGTLIAALNAGGNNPAAPTHPDCTDVITNACTVVFALGGVPTTGALGLPLGASVHRTIPPPGTASGGIAATVSPGGHIGSYVPIALSGIGDTITSVGGPWTTGRVTVSHPGASPAEMFTITGSDGRVNGAGSLSLVAGALSTRAIGGPNANRGWLNLNVTELPEPAAGLGAAAALAALLVAHAVLRRPR